MTARPLLQISAPFLGLIAFFSATLLFVWLFQDILLPFILAAIIAYLIDPFVEKLDRVNKIKRPVAVIFILTSFLIVFSALLAVLLPLLFREATQFIQDLPSLIDNLLEQIKPWAVYVQDTLGIAAKEDLEAVIAEHWQQAVQVSGTMADTLANIGQSMISVITVPVFTVIIAYFMLNEWPKMAKWAADMIPRPYQGQSKKLATDINTKLSGFIRGQFSVAFMLGIGYAIALALAGLNYGILIGFMSGLLGIIPMVGSTIGLLVSVTVAFIQEGTVSYVGIIAAIYFAGQLIEGNILTPKIVGDSVGLHPLWIFFALLAGASLMGIIGMLIAVPVAAIISVLLGFIIEQYKQSPYYQGHE